MYNIQLGNHYYTSRQCTFRSKFLGRVKNCPRKNMVNLGPSLTYQNYHDYNQIPIMEPDYALRIGITLFIASGTGPRFTTFLRGQFSRDHWPMTRQLRILDEMYIGGSVIVALELRAILYWLRIFCFHYNNSHIMVFNIFDLKCCLHPRFTSLTTSWWKTQD